jgi:hypothetical protein
MCVPVMLLNSSQDMCGAEPTPGDATVIASGLAFVAAISSGTERARKEGCTTSTSGLRLMLATGAVSRKKLNLRS